MSSESIKFKAICNAQTPEELNQANWDWKIPTLLPQTWVVALTDPTPLAGVRVLATWKNTQSFSGKPLPLWVQLCDNNSYWTHRAQYGNVARKILVYDPERMGRDNLFHVLPGGGFHMHYPGAQGVMESFGLVLGVGGLSWCQRIFLERSKSVQVIPGFSKLP